MGNEFVFRLPSGEEVARAGNISEFLKCIESVPVVAVEHHFKGKHFSPWLNDNKLGKIAGRIEKLKGSGEQLRKDIAKTIKRSI